MIEVLKWKVQNQRAITVHYMRKYMHRKIIETIIAYGIVLLLQCEDVMKDDSQLLFRLFLVDILRCLFLKNEEIVQKKEIKSS